jgi:hypothetical protein
MEMQSQLIDGDSRSRCLHRLAHRLTSRGADRVCEANLVASELEQSLGYGDYRPGINYAGIGAAECNRDVTTNPESTLPGVRDNRLEAFERTVD